MKPSRKTNGQALVELTLILPLLLIMAFGVIEFSNILDLHLTLTHLTREGANLLSRDRDLSEADIQGYLNTVVDAAKPTFCDDGTGCATNVGQWYVVYSQVIYDSSQPPCGSALTSPGNQPDYYRIFRQGSWVKGTYTQASKLGNNGDCVSASAELETTIKSMAPNRTFHVVEAFYDYRPKLMTPIENFLQFVFPDFFYDRTIFSDS
ncbi:MAG TPA: TadE/TadG family type IV pilus assembly protein [Candidatus Acidoferrales bacterium]|nr:TadE/TadG family type IV pilus assembly protein [Candidatus Acidoferrales bacterium]